jgi:putative ABC transport system permease protein
MDEWRRRLREVVAAWGLSPEDQAGIVEELEQHLDEELAVLRPRVGEAAAMARVLAQVDDPALQHASVRPRHRPAVSVQASRSTARGWAGLVRDVETGWRSLRASRGTTVMAGTALALGIGLTTVMFSIIYGLLLRGLPFENGRRIATVMEANPSRGVEELPVQMHDFFAYRDAQRSFESFGGWSPATVTMSGDEHAERLEAARMTATALELPRVRPVLGRLIRPDDEKPGGPLVAVLSYAVWRDRYAGDSGVLGRSVRLNGQAASIVGVMPEGFRYPKDVKVWVPLRLDPTAVPWGAPQYVNGVARLREGVSVEQANGELTALARRLEAEHAASNAGIRPVVRPFIRGIVPGRVFALLYAMFAAVGLVFLVACTNAANLLLARAAYRTREVAIRIALGASRLAIARQFLVEALVLSLVSAAAGAIVARGAIAVFRNAIAEQTPFWADLRLHPQVFLFIAAAAVVASIVSGLLPALTAARSDVTDVLKDQSLGSSSHRGGRLSRGLVVFELALSAALLVVAAATTKSMLNLRSLRPGFRVDGILTGRVTLVRRDSAGAASFFDRLEAEAARLPGVSVSSLSSNVPGAGWSLGQAAVEGRSYEPPHHRPATRQLAVTPSFFAMFGVEPLRGRLITAEDRAGTLAVAVINQRFADEHFRGIDPIGRRIDIAPTDTGTRWVTIVGIVPNLFAADPASYENPWPPEVITAFRQQPNTSATISVRTTGDAAALTASLRTLVTSLDPDLPVYALTTMRDAIDKARWDVWIFGGLFTVFGVVALVLASIGLYAVLAFSVSRREREMGIRMALGADASRIIRLVFRDGATQLAIGMPLGILLGLGMAGAARMVLFGVQPGDPLIVVVVVGTLAATGVAACIAPALRATRADPVRALRAE